MTRPTDSPALTLAGLTAANGPWLAARLLRLAEASGLELPQVVAGQAVAASSRLLAETLGAEGRPVQNADEAADPVARMGREQAQAHQQAGLSLPASLKVQRLLRRAYDDLVRESWVEKDSRARAHEDVERFFERALVGLVAAWTGYASARPDPELAELVSRREDELRRTLDAAKRLTQALRESRRREQALTERLGQTAAAARKLRDRLCALEASREAAPSASSSMVPSAVPSASFSLESTQSLESSGAARADEAELARLRQDFEIRREALEHSATAARDEANGLRAELHALREAHANLASEAEAMRARLSEAGSRVAELRRAQEPRPEDRLTGAVKTQPWAEKRIEELEGVLERERERATAELTNAQDQMRGFAAERERLRAQAARLGVERDTAAAERAALLERLAKAEAELARRAED
ncbi:MAG: hypothetical protein AUJ49_00965 [Desulfovibrionaceae bacterium CG1_02_65_16]|nr:MAG: hypothetical protein AUJ49_00965 [Desulfovibrionaceae bacterium CG1_02_65_16]